MCDEPGIEERRVEGRYHLVSRRLGDRNRDPDKYARDATLLNAAIAADPHDSRSVFYLAQSLLDDGDPQGALHWYSRRAAMGGWEEEVFYSRLQRARCLERLGRPWVEVLEAYLACWRTRPTRAEPLYEVARHYRLGDHHSLGHLFARAAASLPFPESDTLFIAADAFQWRSLDEQAVTSHYLGRHREALDACTRLLSSTALPEGERARVLWNRERAIEHIADSFLDYPATTVADLTARCSGSDGSGGVTLTITTCKRPDLFERTVNSFLHCCQDLEMISRWICIDDGSSVADRDRMQDLYPFFEFIWKPAEDRGHPTSMNRLVELVDSPYWLHLEDDWHFVVPDGYVTKALAILDEDPRIGQVLFNANYGESLADRDIPGGSVSATHRGARYRVQQYLDPTGDEYQRFFDALPRGSVANVFWPHFSLRPSLLRTQVIRDLGGFDTQAEHFELEFASRYADSGYLSAFFDSIHCLHLGPLTTERGPTRRPNAYALNGTVQFGRQPAEARARPHGDAFPDLDVRVVNLDRRPDRWQTFLDTATNAAGDAFVQRIQRHAAVDGTALVMTPEIAHLFRGNDFGSRRGMIACALSHLAIWEQVAYGHGRPSLIFEDDARLITGFADQLASLRPQLFQLDAPFDVAYLGYFSWQGPDAHAPRPGRSAVSVIPMDWTDHMGGCFGYIVSRPGARRLLLRAEREGIHHGIDWFVMCQAAPDLLAVRVEPHLVSAPVAVPGSHADSNIQHDFEALR